MNLRISHLSERTLMLIGVVWAIVVVTGLLSLYEYQSTSGALGDPALQWPAMSRVFPAVGRTHLVMVAHPRCACTRASLEALARIMAHSQERAIASVLFLKPRGVPAGWEQTDLWHSAGAIPGVRVVCDEGGDEASRFGTETSGHVLLFDRQGRRIFSGGITAGRGHHGDNPGLDLCIALINGEQADSHDTPVFGCSLRDQLIYEVGG